MPVAEVLPNEHHMHPGALGVLQGATYRQYDRCAVSGLTLYEFTTPDDLVFRQEYDTRQSGRHYLGLSRKNPLTGKFELIRSLTQHGDG